MARYNKVLCALMLGLVSASVQEQGLGANANPIRKVVSLLQGISKKIDEEGKKDKKLYDEFMCYCHKTREDLQKSIDENSSDLPQVSGDLEAAESQLKQVEEKLVALREDVAAAKEALASATKERESNEKQYQQESTDYKATINAVTTAITAMRKGAAGKPQQEAPVEKETAGLATSGAKNVPGYGFLDLGLSAAQQAAIKAPLLKAAETSPSLNDDQRAYVTAFLSEGYNPIGTETILPSLEKMQADAQEGLDRVEADEATQVPIFKKLKEAKFVQIKSLMETISKKNEKVGELKVSIVEMRGDVNRGGSSLEADQKALADLEESCTTKEAETNERAKTRNEELTAVSDTIDILNSDDALELFKKTLPSPSLLQLQTSATLYRSQLRGVLRLLQKKVPNKPELGLLAMKLDSSSTDMATVGKRAVDVIEDMIKLQGQEQKDDDSEKDSCNERIHKGEKKLNVLRKHVQELGYDVEDKEDIVASLDTMIKDIAVGIKRLDKAVEEATAQRKQEHQAYVESMQQNTAAKDLLGVAANRLGKTFNLLQKKESEAEDDDDVQLLPATSFLQISSHVAKAEAQHLSALKQMQTSSEEGTKIIRMLKALMTDLDTQMAEAKHEEDNSQKDYEKMEEDAKNQRADAVKSLTAKQGMKAEGEEAYVRKEHSYKDEEEQTDAAKRYGSHLHEQCDWLLDNYDLRRKARAESTESLRSAMGVIAQIDGGAALVQEKKANLRG